MKGWLFVALLLLCGSVEAKEPTRFEAETLMLWHEARGERIDVQQKTLDVLRNRAKMCNCSLHKVLIQKGQYPWTKKVRSWRLTQKQAEFGFKFLSKRSPISSGYKFFNHEPLEFTQKNVKHGGLYFAVK